jgi:outer membrane protein OmpA-like peptidoglycan-associated protein
MNMSHLAAAIAAACIAACPAAVSAADSTLVLVMAGEAYDGPPKFEVDFDGKPLGEGSVAAAIDTARAGRFAAAADKTPYIQSFSFAVPEAVFRSDGEVRIKFLNEAFGGPGSDRDRTLYLASVSLNGRAVTASGLSTETPAGPRSNQTLGEFLVLPDGTTDAVSRAPQGGWPVPSVSAVAPANAVVAPPADATQAIDPMTTSTAEAIPASAPAQAPAAVEKAASADVAARNQDPESGASSCDREQKYNVVGFNENSNALTPRLIERLDQVAADIGDRQCNVQVTGYSSRQGSTASNALFAVERAQNSLKYLQEHGVKFVQASATGVGATDQFGPDYRANRRVVIIVTP